ncbi:MAG TPA: glycosyltransferase family A protein [Bacillales bacterium]|nr:glycosyltransferase family A protein [Bacillales bacterium]
MEGVSVILCTMRQDQIDNVFENFARQRFGPKELIVVLNRDDMDLRQWREKARNYEGASVYKQSEKKPLGACLNFAVQRAKYSYIAKFDDDDYYGPGYLDQAVDALRTTDAPVVGKGGWTTYFEGRSLLAVYKPYNQNVYLGFVGGGTIVFEKNIFSEVKFPLVTHGEDWMFLEKCQEKFKIYSTDKNHYVSIRRQDSDSHTWNVNDEYILNECEIIGHTDDYKSFVDVD